MVIGKTKQNFQSRSNMNDSFQGLGADSGNYSQQQNAGYLQAYQHMLNGTGNNLDVSGVT